MKKLFIMVLLIVGLLIPTVSAEILYDENFDEYEFTGGRTVWEVPKRSTAAYITNFIVDDIAKLQDLQYIAIEFDSYQRIGNLVEGRNEITYTTSYDSTPKQATVETTYYRDLLGNIIHSKHIFYYPDWDIGNATGQATISIPSIDAQIGSVTSQEGDSPVRLPSYVVGKTTITVASGKTFKNHLLISDNKHLNNLNVKLTRTIDGKTSASTLTVYGGSEIFYNDYSSRDVDENFLLDRTTLVTLANGNKIYEFPITSAVSPPDAIPINIRVQNSQTGALLANAHVNISASVNGTFYEVINETVPAGTKTYYLQPTGGGLPNPDFYRLIATVEGYNPIMPYIDFETDIATTIYAYMNPIGGAPIDENKTFIDFYVRDLNANPVSGATVKFGDYTLITNNAGYTIFEVKKDSTYTWTVSKSGYESVTGNAVIGSNDRYTINAVIAPAVTPTLPTPIPTKTPVKPSPTLTSPTGEPVSNLLEWFAAHFGMILGGGVEIGKIFMWLCFTIPAGVFVGNKAKAGAAGFMAGAGIVTLFFVIIGWVPIWLVVILSLIIGLLYAKAFSNIGNGGGR